ncbi:acyl-CoA thioesterase [Deminuibacter soli]|uniref:Acyl-CoA thioesterase n=1 Tax=Deminuibacter soli TaxID=2291815 RepID=A0A3E1NRW4_9BACT|nr:acyl-CoA thioesterase [Deminuibacter soli]RFM30652.1 acyl-CoA thioesterase [Deminuibacter soli]
MEGFKPVSQSETVITELMIPAYANFGGKIHGGTILSQMDKVAYACAAKHAGTYCVTASIDAVDFLAPVEVGELLSLRARVNYVGNSSMVIGIRVESVNVKTGVLKHTNTSYFTMVAQDDDHRTIQVPGLILETAEDVRRFADAINRKKLKRHYKAETEKIKGELCMEDIVRMLEGERCMLQGDINILAL